MVEMESAFSDPLDFDADPDDATDPIVHGRKDWTCRPACGKVGLVSFSANQVTCPDCAEVGV